MRSFTFQVSTGALLAALFVPSAMADTASITTSQDTLIRSVQTGGVDYTYDIPNDAGVLDNRNTTTNAFTPYFQFDLTGLDIVTLNDATLRLFKTGSARNDTIVDARFGVVGLPGETSFSPPNTPQDWVQGVDGGDPGIDYNTVGFEWTDNAAVDFGIDLTRVVNLDADDGANVTEDVSVPNADVNGEGYATLTGPDLVAFITDRLTSSDNPGLVTFMAPIEATNRGWGWTTKEYDRDGDPLTDPATDGSVDFLPYLDLDFVSSTGGTITGDYNDSGQVEQGDLDLVLQNWGVDTDSAGIPASWTNDLPVGQIEQTELDGVLSNWGATSAPDFSGSAVPEPTTFAVLGGLSLLALRRRQES